MNLKNSLIFLEVYFEVLCLTESKLQKDISHTSNINIKGYTHESMPTESSKGGILFYISDTVKYYNRNDLAFSFPRELESLFIEIEKSNENNLIVGGVYKHPQFSNEELVDVHLTKLFNKVKLEKKNIILMGDFNINLLDYEVHETVSNFTDFMFENSMQPHIFAPTRVTSRSKSLIDNIFSNFVNKEITAGNLALGISDHLPQFLVLTYENSNDKSKNISVPYRDFKKLDRETFQHHLEIIDWEVELELSKNDANISIEKFISDMI